MENRPSFAELGDIKNIIKFFFRLVIPSPHRKIELQLSRLILDNLTKITNIN